MYFSLTKKLLLLFLLIISISPVTLVLSQSGGLLSDAEAQRHLDLAKRYEDAGELDIALEEYRIAARASSSTIAAEAQVGITNVSAIQNSFWYKINSGAEVFLIKLIDSIIKVLLVFSFILITFTLGIVFFKLLKLIKRLFRREARPTWVMLPFIDWSNNRLGSVVTENIVMFMLETRKIHLEQPEGVLSILEGIDLPSFSMPGQKDVLESSLKSLDSLDLSGIGLPIGSTLSTILQWMDMGKRHLSGNIQKHGQTLTLSAFLRNRRNSTHEHLWVLNTPIEQEGPELALLDLSRTLAFHILFDTQSGWGASTAKSLQLFTEAMQYINFFQTQLVVEHYPLEMAVLKLEQTLQLDPHYIEAKFNLALVYHNLGFHKEAIDILKELQLLNNNQLQIEIAYNLGAAHYQLLSHNSYNYALTEFQFVVDTLSTKKRSEKEESLYLLALCGLVSVYAQKMHIDKTKAKEYFQMAQDTYKHIVEGHINPPYVLAIAHTSFAIALLNNKQVDEAVIKFDEALSQNPHYWSAYIHKGRAEMKQGNFERAIVCLQQATRLNSSYEFAQYQLGIAYKRAERYDEAISALVLSPNLAHAWNEYGYILAEEYGKYEEAIVKFEKALSLKENYSDALVNVAWYTLEAKISDTQSLEHAYKYAQRAFEIDKNTANIWHRHSILGRILLAKGELNSAQLELEQAIKLKSSASQNYFFLACVFREQGKLKETKSKLAQFLEHKEKSKWFQRNYPIAIAMMKDINVQLQED